MKRKVISIFAFIPIVSMSAWAQTDTCILTASVTQSLSICVGQGGAVLTAKGGTTYSWAPSTGLNSASIANPLANPAGTTTYTVTVSTSPSCSQTATVTLTVNPLPAIVANASPPIQCAGYDVNLTASGGAEYVWSNGNGGDLIAVFPSSTTTYTVTGTSSGGCSNTATVTATIDPIPTITVSPSAPSSCEGTTIPLTASGANTYLWSTGATAATISVSPSSTTNYTVTGTTSIGCVNTASVTVSLPAVMANATATMVCYGTKVTLSGSGAHSYSWSGGVNNGVAFEPKATTTYTLTGTETGGCRATSTVTITVNPLPDITASASASPVCAGTLVTLTGGDVSANSEREGSNGAVIVNGIAGPSYSWSDGVTDGTAFAPAATTTYTVTGTDGYGCSNTATVKVVVDPLPNVVAHANNTIVCAGISVKLTGSGAGAGSYTWTGGVVDGTAFVPIETTTYTVTGTNANGCSNTASISITVNPLPTVIANQTLSAVCKGSGTDVTLSGSGAVSYTWTGGVKNGVPFNLDVTKTYTVKGTDANGCTNSSTATITVNPLPDITATASATRIGSGTPVTLTGGGGITYSWSNGVIDGVAFVPTATATYTVAGTDVNACVNTATIAINVGNRITPFVGSASQTISSEQNQPGGNIYPNPNNGSMTFKYDLAEGSVGTVEIYSIAGKLINTFKLWNGSEVMLNISVPGIENGIYFYRQIVNGEVLSQGKLAIIK
jgi:hypothetical protein